MRRRNCRTGIERLRSSRRRLEEVVECARSGFGIVRERRQLAVLVGADAQRLPRRRPMTDRTEHLFARQHELDRPPGHARGHDAEHLRPCNEALAAEAAAEKRTADLNPVGRNAEQFGDALLRPDDPLARHIDRELVAVPGRHDRVRLHGIVILRRRLVGGGDLRRGRSETGFGVTVVEFRREARADHGRHEALDRIKTHPRRLNLVARRQQHRGFGRGLEGFGDHHRDRLMGVANAIILQHVEPERERIGFCLRIAGERRPVGGRHHLDHAGMRLGGGNIEKGDTAARDAAHRQHRVQHAGGMIVGGVARCARDLEDAVAPGERLAAVGAVANVGGRLRERDIKHERQLRKSRPRGKRAVPARAPAYPRRRVPARAQRSAARARS